MKHEWKKQEKQLYLTKNKPELVNVPTFRFLMIDGKGNPNEEEFSEAVGVLYSLSYAIKMLPKKGIVPEGYFDYAVYPLEGIWDLEESARNLDKLDKSSLIYTIMIRQPEFVDKKLFLEVIENMKIKKPHRLMEFVRFGEIEEGLCVQMIHVGPYDNEPETFSQMKDFCKENNLIRTHMTHREIYISDARKTDGSKMKTLLRFKVEKIDL